MARHATAPVPPPPLGEPPAPPVPSLPFGSFSVRVGRLKQRAAQPRVNARPLVGALQRSPAARKAAVRQDVAQRTQAQAKPQPGVITSAAAGAGEAAAAGVTERARETRKLKQAEAKAAAKPQPKAAPPQTAPLSHHMPESEPIAPRTYRERTDDLRARMDPHARKIMDEFFEKGPGSEAVKQGAATRHAQAAAREAAREVARNRDEPIVAKVPPGETAQETIDDLRNANATAGSGRRAGHERAGHLLHDLSPEERAQELKALRSAHTVHEHALSQWMALQHDDPEADYNGRIEEEQQRLREIEMAMKELGA